MALGGSERAERVLHHLKRQHISTRETLLSLFFRDEKGGGAFSNVVYRTLSRKGLIRSVPIGIGPSVYFQLTETGATTVEVNRSFARDLRPRDLFTLYAELLFCCHDTTPRPKLTPEEFDHYFPGRRTSDSFGPYYIDEDAEGVRRLGRIVVDLGDRNLASAADKALADICALDEGFLAERRVALGVVTATRRAERQALGCLAPLKARGVHVLARSFPALTQLLGLAAQRPAARGAADAHP